MSILFLIKKSDSYPTFHLNDSFENILQQQFSDRRYKHPFELIFNQSLMLSREESILIMLHIVVILKVTVIMIMLNIIWVESGSAPSLNEEDSTSCEEFSRFARFNPYTVLDGEWMAIYSWGPSSPMRVRFLAPTKKQIAYLKYEIEDHLIKPINWTARNVFMKESNNLTYFLEELSDRGHYNLYELYKDIDGYDVVIPFDVRLKQTGDNLYFALMACKHEMVFIFSRIKDVPKKNKIQDVVSRFGYRGRGGRSYLYQGHHWMPMGEADDEDYEQALKFRESMWY